MTSFPFGHMLIQWFPKETCLCVPVHPGCCWDSESTSLSPHSQQRVQGHTEDVVLAVALGSDSWAAFTEHCSGSWLCPQKERRKLHLFPLPRQWRILAGSQDTNLPEELDSGWQSVRFSQFQKHWYIIRESGNLVSLTDPQAPIGYSSEGRFFYTSSGTLRSFYVSCLVLQPILVLDVSKCPIWFVLPYFYCTTRLRFVFYILLETVENIQIEMWFNIKYM